MAQRSRIEIARRRLKVARYSVGVTAAAAFALFAFAARAAHPGTSSGSASTATNSAGVTSSDDPYGDVESSDSFGGFGSSSVSPSYNSAPSVQSGGS
jgi:hypothetical protein